MKERLEKIYKLREMSALILKKEHRGSYSPQDLEKTRTI